MKLIYFFFYHRNLENEENRLKVKDENRLKVKEVRGSQFKHETKNSAKISPRAFIFRHTQNLLEERSVKQMKHIYIWIFCTERFYLTKTQILLRFYCLFSIIYINISYYQGRLKIMFKGLL